MDHTADDVLAKTVAGLAELTSVGVMAVSGHVVEFASDSARSLLGWGDADLIGADWVGMTPVEHRTRDDDVLRDALVSGSSAWMPKEFVRPDGSRVRVEVLVITLEQVPLAWIALLRRTPEPTVRPTEVAIPMAGSLLRLARRLAGAGSVQEVFAAADRLLAPALGAAYANIAVLDGDGEELRIHHDPGADRDVQDRWISVPATADTLLGDAATSGRVLVCEGLDELRSRYPSQGADAEQMNLAVLGAAPLRLDDGRVIGALGVAWRDGDDVDLDLVRACAGLIGNAVALAESVDVDRRAAVAFQRMLLPAAEALGSRHDVAVRYRAVEDVVGGDFYDVIERDGSVWLIIGDVAGHGLPAARTMGKTRFFVRALTAGATSPSRLLRAVSELLIDEQQDEMVTCLAMRHDPGAATLTIATAGHPPPIITADAGPSHQLSITPFPPLGAASWPEGLRDHEVEVPSRLVAFTDGLVERSGEVFDQGLDRLVEFVDTHLDASVEDLADLILKSDLGNEHDDSAVVCVQFAPPGEGSEGPPTEVRPR